MFQNIDELKNEIEVFRDNMNRSNGSIALISEAIEQLNSNLHSLKQISEKFDMTRSELELKLEKTNNSIDEKFNSLNQQIDEIKVLIGETNNSIDEKFNSLNQQIDEIKVLIGETTDKQFETILSTLETFKANHEEKLQREFKTIKILGGISAVLLAVLIVLNFI